MTIHKTRMMTVHGGQSRLGDLQLRCLLLAFLLLAIVYIHPTRSMPQQTVRAIFVVDITQSMNSRDMSLDGNSIDRLTFTKHALQYTIRSLPCRSEVGLAIFTERRVMLLFEPLEVCEHRALLLSAVSAIDWRMAWAADSRIAAGLYDAIAQIKQLSSHPVLLFFTDGQEAPPIMPGFEPRFEGKLGEVNGLIVGVGGQTPAEIPKFDEEGRVIGHWTADDASRFASVGTPTLSVADMEAAEVAELGGSLLRNAPQRVPGALPTHLSWLHESYLMELAGKTGLRYVRLSAPNALQSFLLAPPLAHAETVRVDIRWIFALGALGFVLVGYTIIPTIPIALQRIYRGR